ncbi:VCBS repeat-containing protein [Aequorivita sp. H23M31]|uniref:VCBS repeat-containing protein n=1 Tax=Aequorivita ciconiae TaxID=2494375 RepID=A0A410G775_9FLAO|nr:FG-GAP and VCBS repeat-containing protein [Aequorivita sp. H23M31]QAA83116.1 VCBS repeat-containing protein [Aequorivita sp. H23M31]
MSISAHIDFEPQIIADSHPDIVGPYALATADIYSDGDKDFIATSTNGDIVWFENLDGQVSFSEPKKQLLFTPMNFPPITIIPDDFNGDGKMDIAVGIYGFNQIIWFENAGSLSIEENSSNL